MGWLMENVCSFVTDFISGTIELFGDFINNIFYSIVDMNIQNAYVISANQFIIRFSLVLVILLVVKQVISGYILETDYDSDADPFNLFVRIGQTVAVISCSSWIFDFLLTSSKDLTTDLIYSTNVRGVADKTKALLMVDINEIGALASAYLVMLIIMVISFIIFTIVAVIRACELVSMKLLMPFFALDLLTTNRERWNNFSMGYAIAFFSYSLQMLFFNLALKSYMSVSITNVTYMLGTLAWLIVAMKTPKFLEKYLFKSGIGGVSSGGFRMIAQTAMMRAR